MARISPAKEQCNEKAERESHGRVQGEGEGDTKRRSPRQWPLAGKFRGDIGRLELAERAH